MIYRWVSGLGSGIPIAASLQSPVDEWKLNLVWESIIGLWVLHLFIKQPHITRCIFLLKSYYSQAVRHPVFRHEINYVRNMLEFLYLFANKPTVHSGGFFRGTCNTWHLTRDFFGFSWIGATIRTHSEIQCLPNVNLFYYKRSFKGRLIWTS